MMLFGETNVLKSSLVKMKLSVVSTLYKSSNYIEDFYKRATEVACTESGNSYELIFVDDGSPDDSLKKACEIAKKDEKVKVIELSRNFGHHKAMMTGLMHAKGDFVFLIDSDLEEPPEILTSFSDQLKKNDCDVVFGVQKQRKGGFFERVSGPLYYKVWNLLSGLNIPQNILTARLMKKDYVNELVKFSERELNMAGVWKMTGFKQESQEVKKLSHSPTTYTLRKKISTLVSAITNFSSKPLIFICLLGFFISLASLLYILLLIVYKFYFNSPLSGWTSIMVSIWLNGGIILFCMGIIGIYISKIFSEVKQRPYTIIRKIHTKNEVKK